MTLSTSELADIQCQACLHHQNSDRADYKSKSSDNYPLIRIAQNIVKEQFMLVTSAIRNRTISKQESIVRRSYFVYIDLINSTISGCSEPAFKRAALKYIIEEKKPKGNPEDMLEEYLHHFGY